MTAAVAGVLVLLAAWSGDSPAADREGDDPLAAKVTAEFRATDKDGDGAVSLEEFVQRKGDPALLKRDFQVFDFDGNRRLSENEFAAAAGLVPAAQREGVPDPYEGIVDEAMAALDETYGQWNDHPERTIPAPNFVLKFFRSLAPNDPVPLSAAMVAEVDTTQDGQVTRDEARRFLEIQLGVRAPSGELLRLPSGEVVHYSKFLHIDVNKDNKLDNNEFATSVHFKERPELFGPADTDKNGSLSLDEFSRIAGHGTIDPIDAFRRMDKDLDAAVSPDELARGTQEWQQPLVPSVFPGFDLDGNGRLNLVEYQLTMQANPILGWQWKLTDTNRDMVLSFSEFKFDKGQFPLLRRLFFHRLDRDGSGTLSSDEFTFNVKEPSAFYVVNADGSGWRKLYDSKDYPFCGSPSVSPDGKQIAFDGYASSLSASRVFVMSIDGTNRRELCDGMMPSWSADGKQLACCRNGEAYGVWIINAAGLPLTKVARGWGGQWSPDGKKIAYSDGPAILSYDVATEESTPILKAEESPYTQIYWNMGWSPDSGRLAFKGTRTNGKMEIASIRMSGSDRDLRVHYSGENRTENDIAWSPDGKRVLFGMKAPEDKYMMMYEFNPNTKDPPQRLRGQDPEAGQLCDACWTPDGKQIIINSRGK